jgi:hypothetical protein
VIGFCTTIYFIGKLIDERKMNKLADETARRLREERRCEQLEAEWSNMTKENGQEFFGATTVRSMLHKSYISQLYRTRDLPLSVNRLT